MQAGNFLYVDDDNTSGPWTGTPDNPFQNIPEALAIASSGQTVVVLPGHYPIGQNLSVDEGVGLFLYQGDTLLFGENGGLQIQGSLKAVGTPSDSIYFISSQQKGSWKGIRFINAPYGSELQHCVIENAEGTDGVKGGGIYVSGCSPVFTDCMIKNNHADYGAGIYCENLSAPIIKSCLFTQNDADVSGGGIYGYQTDSLVLYQNRFNLNTATANGGAVMLKNAPVHINQCEFEQNQAGDGGGIYLENVSGDDDALFRNTFTGNTAQNNGGALYIKNTNGFCVARNLFNDNAASSGGAIYFENDEVDFCNNTVFGNTSSEEGGGLFSDSGNSKVYNNIFWNNASSDNSQIAGNGVDVTYNDIEGGFAGTGNFDADPLFLNVSVNDFHLTVLSPCIDSGDTLSPVDPDSTVTDQGMFYVHHLPPEIISQPEDVHINAQENASFDILVSMFFSLQWQESTDQGITWTDLEDSGRYSGTTEMNLHISNADVDLYGYMYRCVAKGIGNDEVVSDPAVLYVYQTISVFVGSETICPGTVEIPVSAENFYRVSAMSLTLNYDPQLIEFVGYTDLNDQLAGNFFFVNAFEGKIFLSWVSTDTVSIGEGVLVKYLFNSLKDGSANFVWDTITPGNCEITHLNGHVYQDTYANGSITVYRIPEITGNPSDKTVNFGQNATFSMNAVGSGLSFQWQESEDDGLNWNNLSNSAPYSGVTAKTLTIINPPVSMNGFQYRCYINGYCAPSDTTTAATLFVNPVITTLAGNTTVCPDTAIIPVSVQEFYNVAAFSLTLNYDTSIVEFSDYRNLHPMLQQGNFVLNADNGQVKISWASINTVNIGNASIMELIFVSQGGTSPLTWDTQTPGNCEYSDYNGHIILSSYVNGNITVNIPPEVTSDPEDRTVEAGNNTSFSIDATGTGLSYRWQVSENDGISWTDLNNGGVYSHVTYKTVNLSNIPVSFDGNLYRCRVNGTCSPSDTSASALLSVTYTPPPQVITNSVGEVPAGCPGIVFVPLMVQDFENVGAFSLTLKYDTTFLHFLACQNLNDALNDGTFVANASGGKVFLSWASTSGATIGNDKLVDLMFNTQSGSGNFIWDDTTPGNCEYTDADGNIILSDYENGSITVYYPPQITAQPADSEIEEGQNTSFHVGAAGAGLSYQWQVSADTGISWNDLSNQPPYTGATSSTLSLNNTPLDLDGKYYRCVVSGTCTPQVVSDFAVLTVNPTQPPPQIIHTTAGTVAQSCTGNIHVPVTVENFNNVAALSLTLYFNPGVLQFDSYQQLNPALQGGQILFNAVNGFLFMSWVSLTPVNIGDGTLFELYFISSSLGGSTDLIWDLANPGNCEYSDITGTVIQSTYTDGSVSVVQDPLIADGGNDTLIAVGETVTLNGTATGGTPSYEYLWSTGETTPSITVSPVLTTNYTFSVTDNTGCVATDYVKVTVPPVPVIDTVDVPAGWSGISSYVIPENPAVENIFLPVVNELVILTDFYGKLYWPAQDVNTIVNWNTHNGYTIKATAEMQVLFAGTEETWKTINLLGNWNLMPVLSKCDIDVETLFDGTNLVIVKEVAGNHLYWPQYGINSLEFLQPGRSYLVDMNAGTIITFPDCGSSDGGGTLKHPETAEDFLPGIIPPTWTIPLSTALTHTVAIPSTAFDETDIKPGDLIGVFDNGGACYGIAPVGNDNISITLYGDDPTTTEKDGFADDDEIFFRHFAPDPQTQCDLTADYDNTLPDHQGVFVTNGLSAIKSFKQVPSSVVVLSGSRISIFPNPSSGDVTVMFSGFNGKVSLEILDLQGKILDREDYFVEHEKYKIEKALNGFSPGIVIFKFVNNNTTIIKKVVIK
jgi:hypothetical protein